MEEGTRKDLTDLYVLTSNCKTIMDVLKIWQLIQQQDNFTLDKETTEKVQKFMDNFYLPIITYKDEKREGDDKTLFEMFNNSKFFIPLFKKLVLSVQSMSRCALSYREEREITRYVSRGRSDAGK